MIQKALVNQACACIDFNQWKYDYRFQNLDSNVIEFELLIKILAAN